MAQQRHGIQVTDFKWFDARLNKWRLGYYMDYYMAVNMMGIKNYLDKAWDVVGIVSGHGKVRIGKSTLAQQMGYYIAWLLAGGVMAYDGTHWVVARKPVRPIVFSLENLVFRPEELIDKAYELFKKYGKNQVIIYDEGRAGLDSARSMEATNKVMADFFQECGVYGHVILIVLPNFFKLHEDYAVNRTLFLVDVFADRQLRRGHFSFYNEIQKEILYNIGRKEVGTVARYSAVRPSWYGRFTRFSPLDKKAYEAAKTAALNLKKATRVETKWKKQRDSIIFLLKRATGWSAETIAHELSVISGEKVSKQAVDYALRNIAHEG